MFPEHDQSLMIRWFPGITTDQYRNTSKKDPIYNCAAWAADINNQWLDPCPRPECVWPDDVPRENTISAYSQLYQKMGYVVCGGAELEEGYEKICLYVRNGEVVHVSKQLGANWWKSKLGRAYDIEHEFAALDGVLYGSPVIFLKRVKGDLA